MQAYPGDRLPAPAQPISFSPLCETPNLHSRKKNLCHCRQIQGENVSALTRNCLHAGYEQSGEIQANSAQIGQRLFECEADTSSA